MEYPDGIKDTIYLVKVKRVMKESVRIPFLIGLLDSWNWRNFGGYAPGEFGIS